MGAANYLSVSFARAEFACPCGCGFGLAYDDVSPRLVVGLQELRDRLGKPIHVQSGCRCVAHNTLVGGGVYSRHLLGQAADVSVVGMTARELYAAAVEIAVFAAGGMGVSDAGGFVHLDVREGDRLGAARWCYTGGKETGWYDA